MSAEKAPVARSCIDCAARRCDGPAAGPYPAFCVSQAVPAPLRDEAVDRYTNDEEDRRLAIVSAGVERDGYRRWPRVQETIVFAKRMGYHRIGIATCVGLLRESRTLAKMLRANGFEVYGAGCKVGEIPKEGLGLPCRHPGENACDPILQARLLAEAKVDLNIVVGLCVGHDTLFYKYAVGPTTTLVVKDRVTGHAPAVPLYQAESYYGDLLAPLPDEDASPAE